MAPDVAPVIFSSTANPVVDLAAVICMILFTFKPDAVNRLPALAESLTLKGLRNNVICLKSFVMLCVPPSSPAGFAFNIILVAFRSFLASAPKPSLGPMIGLKVALPVTVAEAKSYPLPIPLSKVPVISTFTIDPPDIVAVAVAISPESALPTIVTVGAEEYPSPPFTTSTPITCPGVAVF